MKLKHLQNHPEKMLSSDASEPLKPPHFAVQCWGGEHVPALPRQNIMILHASHHDDHLLLQNPSNVEQMGGKRKRIEHVRKQKSNIPFQTNQDMSRVKQETLSIWGSPNFKVRHTCILAKRTPACRQSDFCTSADVAATAVAQLGQIARCRIRDNIPCKKIPQCSVAIQTKKYPKALPSSSHLMDI